MVADFFDSDFNRDGVITADEALRRVEKGGVSQIADALTGVTGSKSSPGAGTSSAAAASSSDGKADDKYIKLGKRIIDRYDSNKDGQLTASEWGKMLMSPAAADGNRDGKITVQEYGSWMQSRQKK